MKIYKVYVASKFENKKNTKELMDKLKKFGFSITFDWTIHNEKSKEFFNDFEYNQNCAYEDLKGVHESDFLVVLFNGEKGPGMMLEIGYALAKHKNIYMVNQTDDVNTKNISIFMTLPNFYHFDNIDSLLKYLNSHYGSLI